MIEIINDSYIWMTRGDTLTADVVILYNDGSGDEYIPTSRDLIEFTAREYYAGTENVITKQVPCPNPVLTLYPSDTASLRPGEYKYKLTITLGDTGEVCTFLEDKIRIDNS